MKRILKWTGIGLEMLIIVIVIGISISPLVKAQSEGKQALVLGFVV
jgi:hypothetical protein